MGRRVTLTATAIRGPWYQDLQSNDCQPRQGRSDTKSYRACTHEHYHNDTWSWAVIDQGRDAQRRDVSCEKRKGETNGDTHRCVAGSLQQQRRPDQ